MRTVNDVNNKVSTKLTLTNTSKKLPTKKHNYKLNEKAKRYIIQAASRFEFPKVILTELERTYKVQISQRYLFEFQQRHKAEIQRAQELWIDRLSDEPLSHKRKRINELQKLYSMMQETYLGAKKVTEKTTIAKRMQDILNQARVEMEGNKITFAGQMLHKIDDSDLQAKVEKIMQLRNVEDAEIVE